MKRLLILFGIAVLVVLLLAGAILGTETGNHWLIRTAAARFIPGLSIERLDGTVFGTLQFTGVRYQDDGLSLEADRAAVRADGLALLGGRLPVSALDVGELRLGIIQSDGSDDTEADLFLPMLLELETAHIDTLILDVDGSETRFDAIRIEQLAGRQRLRFSGVGFTLGAARIDVSGGLELSAMLPADLTFHWQARGARGSGTATGNRARLEIEHALTQPLPLQTTGTLLLTDGVRLDATTRWHDLHWALPGVGEVRSPTGTVHSSGPLESTQVRGSAELWLADQAMDADLHGLATLSSLAISNLSLQAEAAVLRGTGTLTWQPEVAFDLNLEGANLDPGVVWSDWPGRLNVSATLSGGQLADGLRWALDGVRSEGSLRGHSVTVSGSVSGDPSGLQLQNVRAGIGENILTLDGRVAGQIGMDIRIDATDLQLLHPDLAGRLSGELHLDGPRVRPGLRGHLSGTDVTWGEVSAASLELNAHLGSDVTAPFDLDVTAIQLTTPVARVNTFNLVTRGTPGQHSLTLSSQRDQLQARVQAVGALEGRRWTGRIEQLELIPAPAASWQLVEPVALQAAPGEIVLDQLCLRQAPARVCTALNVKDGQLVQLRAGLDSFDLAQLQPWLGERFALNGRYEATLEIVHQDNGPGARLEIHGGPTQLTLRRAGRKPLTGELQALDATGHLNADSASLKLGLSGPDASRLRVDLNVEQPARADAPLNGRVDADWHDLGLLAMFIPELDMGTARFVVDAAVTGTRNAPGLDGSASVTNGRLVYPPLGIALEDLNASATSHGGSTLALEASARAGDGQLTVTGETRLVAMDDWPTRLHLRGQATPLVQLPDAEIAVNPDLDIGVDWPDLRVSGKATVPSARLVLRELPADAERPLPETVVHDERGDATRQRSERVRVYADMDLTLGKDVSYSGLGLEGTVSGSLHLHDEPQQSPQATGNLLLNGRYGFYGQELTISDGQLVFAGPLDNPTLDVKATRKTGDVTAGVRLSGPASAPTTELFSEPAMSESDALSYLLFGRPLATANGDGNGTLNNAALALGVVQALPISSRAQSSLGLDELRLDTGSYETGAIMAGKQVRPDLYIRYTYGLFNRLGGVSVQYKLNEKLGVEARSAEHQSIEVSYTIKRD